jgi:hypothetical protein
MRVISSRPAVLVMAPGDPGDPAGATTAASAPAAPSSAAPAGGSGLVPAVRPNMNSTGMAGFTDLTNTIAGWTLLGCLAGFLLSALVFVLGPAVGLRHARQYGAIGMIAAVGIAALVGLAAGMINLVYTMFSGT